MRIRISRTLPAGPKNFFLFLTRDSFATGPTFILRQHTRAAAIDEAEEFAMKKLLAVSAIAALVGIRGLAQAQVPDGYDPSYAQTVDAAALEGVVTIYTTTDETEAADLLAGFHALRPNIRVEYDELNSTELFDRFLSEAVGKGAGDLVWSSAMDQQMKLVNDGYAETYASPEAARLPQWAVWNYQAYGVTAEPVAIAYNKGLLPAAEIPKTHTELARLLAGKAEALKGKVATYDPERSAVGLLFISQDLEITKSTWDLVRAIGEAGAKLYSTTSTMLDRIAVGDQLIAYNVIGSYALERAKQEPALGVVLPADYTIVMSRIVFIPKGAPHPNAARLFLDYLLSKGGQTRLAARSLGSVRDDVPANPFEHESFFRPIRVGPELLTYLDQAKRNRFLKEWRRALQTR
jgi:iron(III) transport system substrate-binding protein